MTMAGAMGGGAMIIGPRGIAWVNSFVVPAAFGVTVSLSATFEEAPANG